MQIPARSLMLRSLISQGRRKAFKFEWFVKGCSTCEFSRVFFLGSKNITKEKFTIVANRGYTGDFDYCKVYDISQREDMDNAECNGIIPTYLEIKKYGHK